MTTSASIERGPSGTAWLRTTVGSSTGITSRSISISRSNASQAPWTSSVSPTAISTSFEPRSSPLRWIGQYDEIAALGHHPGKHASADESRPRRNHQFHDAISFAEQLIGRLGEPRHRQHLEPGAGHEATNLLGVAAEDHDVADRDRRRPSERFSAGDDDTDQVDVGR